jgi:hypothetical protein
MPFNLIAGLSSSAKGALKPFPGDLPKSAALAERLFLAVLG